MNNDQSAQRDKPIVGSRGEAPSANYSPNFHGLCGNIITASVCETFTSISLIDGDGLGHLAHKLLDWVGLGLTFVPELIQKSEGSTNVIVT